MRAVAVRRQMLAHRLGHGDRYEHHCLSRAEVERLATRLYDWRKHLPDDESYWVTGQRAAELLGLSRARLNQLADADRLPFEVHRDGTRLYRRAQLQVLSQAW